MAGKTKDMSQIKQLLLLKKEGVSNRKYVEEHPDDHYSLTQFRFHYSQNTEAKKESPSTVLADMRTGGEKLFLDFTGDTMGYIDLETGEMVQCQAFVATLPASDYGFLLFVPSQRTEDFVYAITQCLKHLGGVSRMLVPDNLKAAVVKTDRYEPSLNRVLEDMANHYGTVVVPARPVRPRDKSNVEGNVRLVYMRVFAELRNETFYSIDELNWTGNSSQRTQETMPKASTPSWRSTLQDPSSG